MANLRATRRIWIPFALAALCLVAASFTGSVLTWVLLLAALGLVLDGATKWFSGTGHLEDHRQ
jgi:hypothetical protein